jgi:hypothetical protein
LRQRGLGLQLARLPENPEFGASFPKLRENIVASPWEGLNNSSMSSQKG